jgi:hypothetical protein
MKSLISGAVVLFCCALSGTGLGIAAMASAGGVVSHSAAAVAPVRNGAVVALVREGASATPVVPNGAATTIARELAGNPGTFVMTPCHPWSCAS